ncbi:methionine--tRNA ligase MSM1 NDAI_0D02030 [Naumovozyma dairenensis CBS 421]|uniref:Methionine--tRNA ligase, mitochondrial n=1 Tax=Naumovozyma dairenensis (strain ATCC 10597 / BCRC 20456 / CBS 421 / NBRC 0211 / NRRL Y-12639) TaxID=1071378 RepID=G0W9Q6_NAUDC|nr:hypothetical protein NDAI_0D02030 [Naumovozyma dairenensis CBS 421]CCD24517.1 hypothetical protein NDAI_0D02030 [Naumovozyma dairenensis CBS 421]
MLKSSIFKSNITIQRKCYHLTKPTASHITTPIFYPNAKPHLGHLYSSLLCDVFHRWNQMKNVPSLFTTGTDEHGLKIQMAAEKNGFTNPKFFVDKLYQDFISLDQHFNIKFTRFIRTTDPDHIKNVEQLWNLCLNNGFIYKGEHNGWYSISDETFYPESKIIKDPHNNDKYINTETNNEVFFQSEENYFFKLSTFQEKLIHLISDPNSKFQIYPESKRKQILKELQNGTPLQDLSISRSSSRLKWGIQVPNDPSQKIYVWFDALCNYITSIGGINALLITRNTSSGNTTTEPTTIHEGIDSKVWWSNTTHLIGKDIMKFHTVYWPSFLMAAGLPLPKQVVIHNHWISDGLKMSKSLGNVVDPIMMANKYGADIVRWYLLENSKLDEDGDFQELKLKSLRSLLVSKWGNLINRCCGKKFNISRAVQIFTSTENSQDVLSICDDDPELQTAMKNIISELEELPMLMDTKLVCFEPGAALRKIWSIINFANTFVQIAAPWNKTGIQQDVVIFLCMETSRIIAILTQPIIPDLSKHLLDFMKVSNDRRSLSFAKLKTDDSYGFNMNDKSDDVPIPREVESITV